MQEIVHSNKTSPFAYNEFPKDSEKMKDCFWFLYENIRFVEYKQCPHPETGIYSPTRIFYVDEELTFGFICIANELTDNIEWYWLNKSAHVRLSAERYKMFKGDNS